MGTSTKRAFKKAVIIAAFGTSALTMACGNGKAAPSVSDADRNCVTAKTILNPKTDNQKRLADIFNKAAQTKTGKSLLKHAMKDDAKICFDPELDKVDACGFFTVGAYYPGLNIISLNPSTRLSDETIIKTLVHEARHKKTEDAHQLPYFGNVPEWERITRMFITEADARMTSVVFAYEKKKQGDGRYWNALLRSSGYRPIVKAFDKSLSQNPKDMKAAMRAGMWAFFEMPHYTRNYANNVVAWIEKYDFHFDPDRPASHMVTDSYMKSVGQSGSYGNYMNDALMQKVRTAYTQDDYNKLAKARAESGGTKGSACKPAKKTGDRTLTS